MPDVIFELERNSRPIQIRGAGIVLRAPGLRGRATYRGLRTEGEVRIAATAADPDPIDAGLAEVGGLEVHQLEIQAPTPEVARPENVRGDEGELRADELEADFPCKPDEFTFAIYRDEDGVTSIHFPELVAPGKTLTTRAPAEEQVYRYRIQLRPELGVQPQEVNVRGWGLLNKALKFVVGKIAGRVVGLGIYGAVWEWESAKRAYQGLHGGKNLAELLGDEPTDFTDWKTLEGKRSLLFIHGTTSTTSGAFGELGNFGAVAQQLYTTYENRVLGFNHHTLTKHVSRNVIEFYDKLPKNSGPYEFDVVCHSRGGLVARAIKELTAVDISHLAGDDVWHPPAKVTINRITFVGTPNNGTDLANPNHIPKALNRLANIATLIPGAGLSIGGVLSWAALIAEAGLKALPGLVDQAPGSDLLLALNHPSPATGPVTGSDYYAIQSNYEPGKNTSLAKAILAHTENAIVDLLFMNNRNDLIVPTLGVSKIDQGELDAGRVKYFGQVHKDDVAHTRFFKEEDTWNHILTSLR